MPIEERRGAGAGTALGAIALIAAILALLLPVVGILWFAPLAVLFGIPALAKGAKGFGIAVVIIVVVKMVISPTFWLNIGAGAQQEGASANRMITYILVLGTIVMLIQLVRGSGARKTPS